MEMFTPAEGQHGVLSPLRIRVEYILVPERSNNASKLLYGQYNPGNLVNGTFGIVHFLYVIALASDINHEPY